MVVPRIEKRHETETEGKFIVEPLERGYGVTLGNSLRRVLLSSIEGAAITSVQIDRVLHEFSTIPGVREDVTQLLLNLKNTYVRLERDNGHWPAEPQEIRVEKRGQGRVTAADFETGPEIEIANPENYIATLSTDDAELAMVMTVEVGRGYVLPDKHEKRSSTIGVIPIGATFTPVRKVNFNVEQTRVGNRTDFERLTIDVVTNGTIRPSEALGQAAHVLDGYFRLFFNLSTEAAAWSGVAADDNGSAVRTPDARIEELDFSARTQNCLKKANILTISELVLNTDQDLMNIRNFGKKSLVEVRDKLATLGLTLKHSPGGAIDISGVEDEDEEEDEAADE